MDEALAENRIEIPAPSPTTASSERGKRISSHRELIQAWKDQRKKDEAQRVKENEPLRKADRELYRRKQAELGLSVRPYRFHKHEPRRPDESAEDYQLRINRDRGRTRRGVTPDTVRTYTDLSHMTPEQRAEHKRAGAKKRQQKWRQKELTTSDAPELGSASEEIREALAMFDRDEE